jgi:DNA-binding MarR family transcriptional regulator
MSAYEPEVVELADRLMPALFRAVRRIKRDAPPLSLNPVELMVLFTVQHVPGIGMAELAAREGISSPTMSAHVKRLETAGLITREVHAADRRRTTLALTPAAHGVVDSAKRQGSNILADRLACLDTADREALAQAIDALLRLAGDWCVKEVS